MRCEAGNCAIVVSIKRALNDVLKMIFNFGHIFVKKAIIYGFFMILGQNSTDSKMAIIGMLHLC